MTHQPLIAEVPNQQHTLTAIVEQDARTAYFYIWPNDLFRSQYAVRGCWLRNLLPAPAQEDREAMEQVLRRCSAPAIAARWKRSRCSIRPACRFCGSPATTVPRCGITASCWR